MIFLACKQARLTGSQALTGQIVRGTNSSQLIIQAEKSGLSLTRLLNEWVFFSQAPSSSQTIWFVCSPYTIQLFKHFFPKHLTD